MATADEKAAAKAAAEEAKAIKEAEKAAAKAAKSSVTVEWNGGSRVYSKEVHGDDFEDLAKQFAAKFSGTIA